MKNEIKSEGDFENPSLLDVLTVSSPCFQDMKLTKVTDFMRFNEKNHQKSVRRLVKVRL